MPTFRLLVALIVSIAGAALAQEPQPLQTIRTPGGALAISMDGKLAIGPDEPGPLRVLDFAANEIWTQEYDNGACVSLDLTGDGRLMAAVRVSLEPRANNLSVWDVNTKERLWETPEAVFWAKFSPDGTMVATGRHGAVRFYHSKLGSVLKELPAHLESDVMFGEYSESGNLLVTAGDDDRKVMLWVVATAENKGSIPLEGDKISALAVSDEGELVAVAQGPRLSVIDGKTGDLKWSKTAAEAPIRALDFRPKSIQLAAGSLDGVARVWSGVTGEQLDALAPEAGMVEAVKYSTDGLVLFVGTSQVTLKYSGKPRSEPDEVRASDLRR
jgi:WD40 repeat protein